jgi:glycosyltransferase involved in cell wall biosynthesis
MIERKNIIIQAPVFSASGYGAHSREIIMNLFNSGNYNISCIPVGWGSNSTLVPSKDVDDALVFMCNNRISNGADFIWMQIGVPHEFRRVSNTYNIGVTAGLEVEQYPVKWAAYCNQMDAIIVPSTFVRDRLVACGVKTPVYVVPEGVDTRLFNDNTTVLNAQISNLEFPTDFNFLIVGQWSPVNIGEDRKNILFSIHAVLDAFQDAPDVGVVVKTHMYNNSSPDRYSLFERMREVLGNKSKGRVHFIHGTLTELEMAQLYKHPKIHAFVSLTHGEGFGRPIAEAAACDLPLVVTGWSGHMDFVKKDLANVIEYKLDQVPPSQWMPELLGPGQMWAYPDYDKSKNRLRKCRDGYDVAKQRAKTLGKEVRENYSLNKIADILNHTMETILMKKDLNIGQVGRVIV